MKAGHRVSCFLRTSVSDLFYSKQKGTNNGLHLLHKYNKGHSKNMSLVYGSGKFNKTIAKLDIRGEGARQKGNEILLRIHFFENRL